ncbi:MAG: hypothetical protein R8G33_01015 [Gammaproteobacteria bacterium]|nr:hypothetical protein [Gammaproteobacteria bacterium]
MRTFFHIFFGLIIGLITAWFLTLIFLYAVPFIFSGLGQDSMSQGIMGTLLLVFTAPLLGVLGGLIGYRKSKNISPKR